MLLRGNLRFWRGIAIGGLLGIQMLLLDVRDILGYMAFESRGDNLADLVRRTNHIMLDGIIRRPSHRLIHRFVILVVL